MTASPRNDAVPASRELGDRSIISRLDPRAAQAIVWILLVGGVQIWLLISGDYGNHHQIGLLLGAIFVSFLPPARRGAEKLWTAIARPSPRTKWATALLLAVGCSFYLFWTERGEEVLFGLT